MWLVQINNTQHIADFISVHWVQNHLVYLINWLMKAYCNEAQAFYLLYLQNCLKQHANFVILSALLGAD